MNDIIKQAEKILSASGEMSPRDVGYICRVLRQQEPKDPVLKRAKNDGRKVRLNVPGANDTSRNFYCPSCGRIIMMNRMFMPSLNRHCMKCGQTLRWTDEAIEAAMEHGLIEKIDCYVS
jgi:predicted RNA-binding Zn-ribbon protein involved in translation (DUF1610 family)